MEKKTEKKNNGETCRISLIYVSRCDVMLRNTLWTMHEIGTFGHYVRLTTVSISILELELRWASVQLQICAKAIIAKQMNRKLSSEDYYNNFNLTGCKCRESIQRTQSKSRPNVETFKTVAKKVTGNDDTMWQQTCCVFNSV